MSDGNFSEIVKGDLRTGQEIVTDSLNKKGSSTTQRPPPRFM